LRESSPEDVRTKQRQRGLEWADLTDAERSEIELEENLQRNDLTAYERSKTLVKLAETAKTVLIEQAELRGEIPRNEPGRPPQPASEQAVADRLGVDKKAVRDAQQHVEIATEIPALAGPDVGRARTGPTPQTSTGSPEGPGTRPRHVAGGQARGAATAEHRRTFASPALSGPRVLSGPVVASCGPPARSTGLPGAQRVPGLG
jgi:hypothetical protein